MAIIGNDSAPLHFSTSAFPERDRIAVLREVFGRKIARFEFEPLSEDVHADITVRAVGSVGIASIDHSLMRAERTREMLTDGNDALVLQISMGGCHASHLDREVMAEPGDALMGSNGDVGTFTCSLTGGKSLLLSFARRELRPLVRDFDAILMQRVPAPSPALRLLLGYVGIFDDAAALTPELQHLAVGHLYDLAAVMLGATRDAVEAAKFGGVRAARLRAVKTDVLAHLGEHDLSINAVATRQGISPVYIRKLFDGEATSFSAFVLEKRLAQARRVLLDPRAADRGISKIAMDAGFGDLSYFNRVFRRRFGATPSDVRASGSRREET
jgi:AraC-like DNA-binding protein